MNKLSASVAAFRASTVICVVTLFAMATVSCTSTGSSPTAGTVLSVAPTTTTTSTATANAMPVTGSESVSPEALALAGGSETNALKTVNDAAAQPGHDKSNTSAALTGKDATVAQAPGKIPGKTALFGSSAPTPQPEAQQQIAALAPAAAKPPVKTSLFGSSTKAPEPAAAEQPQQVETPEVGSKAAKAAQAAEAQAATTQTRPGTGKDNGRLVRLFSNNNAAPPSKRLVAVIQPKAQAQLKALSSDSQVQMAGLPSPSDYKPTEHLASLPGVRPNGGIVIMQRDSLYQDDDEGSAAPVILASAAGLARLAPNGLRVQRESVDVACLKPQLVGILKTIERRYGKSVIVTSGYRSPPYNRLVNGAKASLHMSCAAADIQVPGVSKWELANFARSMPGRGGVGTYCYTESVHVDIGPTRDWNWRCGRRRS
ncbi:YcbK family protein [Phyllobacterium meliloti]|uniref:YcbK family protein n=1 Tax=Phyllobacterium meliloti TaxID=555317 RepID=UPI001D14D105|nr:YcbK family protein [Phyllobacterium sp. T1293]UGX87208.1 YcbK family protein [Phyllobacterium sp. T1293]